jgi:hypothetical protein
MAGVDPPLVGVAAGPDQRPATGERFDIRTTAVLLLGTLVGWLLVFAKTGSAFDISIHDYVARANALPSLTILGDALADYRNWSLLPLVIARTLGVGSGDSFAALQCVILVVGTALVIAAASRRHAGLAVGAALALFATMVPSYALYFMGSYDQLLVVALVAVVLVERPGHAAAVGVVIGLTHAEVGVVSLAGLLVLALIGVGHSVRSRAWALGGVVAARLALTVVLAIGGQSSDRSTYISEYGLDRLLESFADVWPLIVLTAAAGGWVIVATAIAERRDVRFALVVAVILAVNVAVSAVTIDESRVVMLTTLPLILTLAAFPPHAAATRPWWARAAPGVATAIGLATPLVFAWVGEAWRFGDPFHVGWPAAK